MSTCYLVDNPDILLTVKKRSNQGEGQQFVPLGALEQSRHKKDFCRSINVQQIPALHNILTTDASLPADFPFFNSWVAIFWDWLCLVSSYS